MPLRELEHFLIQVRDLRATADWYVKVLGFREGWHPDFRFPVIWLYLGERDVLHLTEGGETVSQNRLTYLGQHSKADQGTGVIDHVAFRCDDLPGTLSHLRALNIEFQQRMVDSQGLYQIFLFDPNGLKIELNFANQEAMQCGISADVIAASLPITEETSL